MLAVEAELKSLRERVDEASVCSTTEHSVIQGIRNLENKLEKAAMKSAETTHIGRTYEAIREKLLEEQCTYANTVEAMEHEIRQSSAKLTELKAVSEDAVALRDQTKEELKRHEEVMYAHRKRRELELVNMRRTLDVCHEQAVPTKSLVVSKQLQKYPKIDVSTYLQFNLLVTKCGFRREIV